MSQIQLQKRIDKLEKLVRRLRMICNSEEREITILQYRVNSLMERLAIRDSEIAGYIRYINHHVHANYALSTRPTIGK